MKKLAIVRHGESLAQLARKAAGKDGDLSFSVPDPLVALSALGRTQALAFGEWLRSTALPTRVLCSTYHRARETCELALLSAGLEIPVEYNADLREIDWGEFDGLSFAERSARWPEIVKKRKIDKYNVATPGGESWAMVVDRVRPIIATLAELEGYTLIVCHEVTLKCTRLMLEGLTPAQVLALPETPNTGVTLYSWGTDGWVLEGADMIDHLAL